MRRPGEYGDPGGNAYVSAQMQHISGQRMEQNFNNYQGRPEYLTSEKEHPCEASRADGNWRWERDGSSNLLNQGQAGDPPRSYYKGRKSDPRMLIERQGNNNPRSNPGEEDMDIGYEDKPILQTVEGIQQRFRDEIMKLAKEQNDAEDAENARHRESINNINSKYLEHLGALRALHATQRDELLKRGTEARQLQYQQMVLDHYPNSGTGHGDPQGYPIGAESHRGYSAEQYDSYRERARFPDGYRDPGLEPRGQYHGTRVDEAASRYH